MTGSAPLDELLADWELVLDGPPLDSRTATVVPVRSRDGASAVLKVGGDDAESEHEHLALTRWDGDGAVRLLRADPRRRALLLERLGPASLEDVWDVQACEIVAGLYARLHRPTGAPFVRLTDYFAEPLAGLAALPRNAPLPRRLVEQAIGLGRDLAGDEASNGILIHTDLHYENVLLDADGTWRAIDPKPLSGDPHYEVAPLLWNRFDELAGDVRDGIRRRFHTVVDAAGLDERRARDWVVVRMMVNAWWQLSGEDPGPDEWLTTCVAVAKAVQD
ncbi:aminoglycoside phosphotransferase family protein [Nocardioides marmoriginsengisoli]|uniref:aminoglycoside phosphotransferase family protein n=1 Tax=Nocardioides marmoriginsengisoli TaxID=661483 RepID=UPI001FE3EBF8|nr:aminoglycoside phosphotransferase family protein [Nocardioides marmoriginsengisoli]